MGAWGYRSFENDDALDFIAEVIESGGIRLVEETLAASAGAEGMDAAEAGRIVAAAEIVAYILGQPATDIPSDLQAWLAAQLQMADPQPAREAVNAVLVDSELSDLWKESGEYRKWRSVMLDLLHRLGGEFPAPKAATPRPANPRPNHNHLGVPPIDTRARRILLDSFWKNGWLSATGASSDVTPEETQYARENGFLFLDQELIHDAAVASACQSISQLSIVAVSNAFLASLTSRRLELRSALGSFAVGRRLVKHKYSSSDYGGCAYCGLQRVERYPNHLSTLSFERHKWGGVRHEHVDYIAFDLAQFANLPPCTPTDEDLAIFGQILDTAASLPPKVGPGVLVNRINGLFTSTPDERKILVTILGYCGVLQPARYPSFTDEFVPFIDRCRLQQDDWNYPISQWRGSNGVNRISLTVYFPQFTWKV